MLKTSVESSCAGSRWQASDNTMSVAVDISDDRQEWAADDGWWMTTTVTATVTTTATTNTTIKQCMVVATDDGQLTMKK